MKRKKLFIFLLITLLILIMTFLLLDKKVGNEFTVHPPN